MAIFQQQPKKGFNQRCELCRKCCAKTLGCDACEFSLCIIPVSTNIAPWNMCKFSFMCRATIPFFGISQIIVFIGALQFITFCAHARGKQSDKCCGLLWTNRSEKTVVLSTVPDFQQRRLQMVHQSFFEQVLPTRELWLPRCNTLQWCSRININKNKFLLEIHCPHNKRNHTTQEEKNYIISCGTNTAF